MPALDLWESSEVLTELVKRNIISSAAARAAGRTLATSVVSASGR